MDTARRAAILRLAMGHETQQSFAAFLGVTYQRWNNIENGFPLTHQMAAILAQKTGISFDWLYSENPAALTVAFAGRLKEAENTLTRTSA